MDSGIFNKMYDLNDLGLHDTNRIENHKDIPMDILIGGNDPRNHYSDKNKDIESLVDNFVEKTRRGGNSLCDGFGGREPKTRYRSSRSRMQTSVNQEDYEDFVNDSSIKRRAEHPSFIDLKNSNFVVRK